jgi:hypothetical protein
LTSIATSASVGIDDDRAPALEPDTRLERALDLLMDAQLVEEGAASLRGPDPHPEPGQIAVEELAREHQEPVRVDDDLLELLRDHVAQEPLREIEVTVDQDRRAARALARLDRAPETAQVGGVAGEGGVPHPLGGGPHDPSPDIAPLALGELGETVALRELLDAPRDEDPVDERQVHERAPRQGDLRRQPGALRRHRLLGDLDEDLLPLAQQVLDRRRGRPRRDGGGHRRGRGIRLLGRVERAVALVGLEVELSRPRVGQVRDVRNASLSAPMSTKAACIPGMTRPTRPL